MPTFDLVLLSSSPPSSSGGRRYATTPPSNQQRVMMPAHPSLLLASHEAARRDTSGALKSGSRAAPVPQGVERGFATASSLVQSHHFSTEAEAAIDVKESEEVQPKRKTRKPPRNEDDLEPIEAAAKSKPKKTRKTKPSTGGEKAATKAATNATSRLDSTTTSSHFATFEPLETPDSDTTTGPANTTTPKITKPRAKRTKKATTNAATTDATTTVTADPKPKRPRKPRARAGNKEDEALVTAPQKEARAQSDEDDIWDVPKSTVHAKTTRRKRTSQALVEEPLDLDEAVGRRQDWTPVKDTHRDSGLVESGSEFGEHENFQAGVGAFTSMVSNFAFAEASSEVTIASKSNVPGGGGITKRRRVELIDLPTSGPSPVTKSPEKGKASKRKARTITDLVTGQYIDPPDMEYHQSPSDGFHPQTTTTTTTTTIPLNDVTNQPRPTAPTKLSKTRVSKPKKSTLKASTKSKIVAQKLLSPGSAAARARRQDVLFGTSSQLALEESPEIIREIQYAIKESEYDAEFIHTSGGATGRRMQSRLEKVKGRRGLWAASSRDDDGDLLEKQDIRLPEPDRTQDFPLLMDSTCRPTTNSFEDIDNFKPPCPPHMHDILDTPGPSIANLSFDDIDNYEPPPPSNQEVDSGFLDIDDFPVSKSVVPSAAASSYAKPRDPIPLSKPVSSSPSRPTRRKKKSEIKLVDIEAPSIPQPKSSQRRFIEIDEILDSEDDEALSPIPPNTSRLTKSPPLSLIPAPVIIGADLKSSNAVVSVNKVPTAHLQWTVIKSRVFSKITSEIRALPPSNDLAEPTWHEKILMYDPIPLEKFTDFLNKSTSIRTWRRATQKQVKAFNKERKSNSEPALAVDNEDDEVLVIEKELEAWMVQAWCQEMSVCCVSTDNKGARLGMGKGLY